MIDLRVTLITQYASPNEFSLLPLAKNWGATLHAWQLPVILGPNFPTMKKW